LGAADERGIAVCWSFPVFWGSKCIFQLLEHNHIFIKSIFYNYRDCMDDAAVLVMAYEEILTPGSTHGSDMQLINALNDALVGCDLPYLVELRECLRCGK